MSRQNRSFSQKNEPEEAPEYVDAEKIMTGTTYNRDYYLANKLKI